MAETQFKICSDCDSQDGLDETIQAIMRRLPERALNLKSVSNIAVCSDPTVIASLIAGTGLILSKLIELFVTELLRRHREKQTCDRPSDSAAGTMAEVVPALVLVYDNGPPEILVEIESVPRTIQRTKRTIIEIRLTRVDRLRASRERTGE